MVNKFEFLPLLISRNIVVFPNATVNIEIGREQSIFAIYKAIKSFDSQIIVSCQKKYTVDNPVLTDIHQIGTLSQVKIIKENKDKSLLIEITGLKRVTILDLKIENIEKSFLICKTWFCNYEVLKEKNISFAKNKNLIFELLNHFEHLFEANDKNYAQVKELFNKEEKYAGKIVDKLCNLLPNSDYNASSLKQMWLEQPDISKRIHLIINTDFLSDVEKEEINNTVTKKVNKNISKQQKEFYLREKIKVMKDELGENGTKEIEIKKIKEWLKKPDVPKRIKLKVEEELNKLEYTSGVSNETLVIKNYIDWLMALPWSAESEDEEDVKKIQKSLDLEHYGLTKVKERIAEFIAVQKRTKNKLGTIICFVGPPGVGKTSLAKAIARSLNKEYIKIALGGLSDEAEIRGHRKTYVASMPGKIIKGLKQAKVKNPLFLLDEIDKLSNGYHGDPISALLEVLDPKQNMEFSDNYIEESFDLSKIMFIATANYEENIPEALLDRLELIYLTSYTEHEKLFIAKNNLINEVIKEHAIEKDELIFEDNAITYLIQRYTKEAGVRLLKQQLAKIARKFIMKQNLTKIPSETITIELVKKYLSKEIYSHTVMDEVAMPGIVNGMAYTEYGGDLLPIEINFYVGKGNILLTGNLKETMKESANVALSFIKANESKFKLKNINWSDLDINLHVPSGGIPKDGPSAGVTITTALLSAFLKVSIPSTVAMTGEMTLRGKILPIGGLKEKIISAVRGGVNEIFFPKECERYLEDIPKEILSKITLHPVKYYEEIYNKLFVKK